MFPVNDLTVLIVTFKTDHKILDECIKSIDSKSKIIIVENSNDQEFKKKYEEKFSNIEVFLSGKNLGYGVGNNFGLNLIKTNYALISNPDVVYEKDFFSFIDHYIKQDTEFDIIGPMYRKEDYASYGHFEDLKKISPITKEGSLFSAHWIVGCTMLLNLKKFKDRNLFDENFFLYFEEVDILLRSKREKIATYLFPFLKIKHMRSSSIKKNIKIDLLRAWHYMWSMFYFYKKNFGYISALKKTSKFLIKDLIVLLISIFFFDFKKMKLRFFRLYGLISSILGLKSFLRP